MNTIPIGVSRGYVIGLYLKRGKNVALLVSRPLCPGIWKIALAPIIWA